MLSAESLGHIANLLFGAAYLVRGILWLRILSIVACVIMAFFNYFAPAEPLWVAIYWNVSFTLVNLIQVWLLLREKGAVSFTEEEKELYQTMFRQMSPVEFMKILRIAHWNTLDAGEAIIRRGSTVSQLSLIYHGSVRVSIDDEHQVDLKDGAFLG